MFTISATMREPDPVDMSFESSLLILSLCAQAMVLAQQIQPEALRRGSHGGLLAEVCGVLEAPPGGSEGAAVPPGGPLHLPGLLSRRSHVRTRGLAQASAK